MDHKESLLNSECIDYMKRLSTEDLLKFESQYGRHSGIMEVCRKIYIDRFKLERLNKKKRKRIKERVIWVACDKLCPDMNRLVAEYL